MLRLEERLLSSIKEKSLDILEFNHEVDDGVLTFEGNVVYFESFI